VIGQSQRPLPDNTQHSQETDIHAPGGIQTRNPSKRATADHALDRAAIGIAMFAPKFDFYKQNFGGL
jgi:hypothetical protein